MAIHADDRVLTGAGSVPKFYVLDGQHRLETMGELKRTNGAVSARPLPIPVGATQGCVAHVRHVAFSLLST